MSDYYVLIPENLQLEEILDMNPPNFDFNIDFAHYEISNILKYSSYQENPNDFVGQCSDYLEPLNRNYKKHMHYLCEFSFALGNILWRENYSEEKCFSYKLAPTYQNQPLKAVQITDKKLIRKVRKENSISNKLRKKYGFLIGYFDPKRLTIDIENALKFSAEELKNGKTYRNYLKGIFKVLEIHNKEFSMTYNPKTDSRVHTNITRLDRKLRSFLRYDGKKLVEIDISASIPTFLYYLLSNLSSNNLHINNLIKNQSYTICYMSVKNLVTLSDKEVQLFGQLVLNKGFYEWFIDDFHSIHLFDPNLKPNQYYQDNVKRILGHEFDGDEKDLRAVVKKNILSMFNAPIGKYTNEQAVFNKYFPSILRFIKKLKAKRGKHNNFSFLLYQIESYFVLNIVARRLNNNYRRKIPFFTLHDCLIVKEDDAEFVYQFVIETLTKELGFTPRLTKKHI